MHDKSLKLVDISTGHTQGIDGEYIGISIFSKSLNIVKMNSGCKIQPNGIDVFKSSGEWNDAHLFYCIEVE